MKIHPSIRSFTFCPKCGQQDCLKNTNKNITCTICQFCFYFNPSTAVVVILENSNKEFLILKRNQEPGFGLLDLPGGFVDPFETAQEAAIREIKEELNICIKKLTFITTAVNLYTYREVTYQTVDIAFYSKLENEQVELNDENNDFYWIKSSELPKKQFAFPSISSIISEFLEQIQTTEFENGV